MSDIEALVAGLINGEGDATTVPLGDAVDVADALAEGGHVEPLLELTERVLPRFVKKERVDAIEGIWLACCTAEVLPIPLLMRTAQRVAARGVTSTAEDLVVMLADTLVEVGRAQEALTVLEQGLGWAASHSMLEAGGQALSAIFPDVEGLDETLARLSRRRDDRPDEALRQAERTLRYAPGAYLLWTDGFIARVASTDGTSATIEHPSGVTERRAVDEEPPPRVLSPDAQEVLRLYAIDTLRKRWQESPTESLETLLDDQGGWIRVPGLQQMLVPQVMPDPVFEATLATLKVECGLGREDRPSYESKRRLFIAAGTTAPRPKRRPKQTKKAPAKKGGDGLRTPLRATSVAVTPILSPTSEAERARWVNLTSFPEIRALISHTENDVRVLTKELNTELPVRLEEALAHGDLKENAEYDAAKDRLRFVQARISQLQTWLAQLHELSRVRLIPGRVTVMSVVTVTDVESGEERRFRLVPAELREPQPGDVSVGTPYGRALLGKQAGDVVVVELPRRTEKLEIIRVVDPDEA